MTECPEDTVVNNHTAVTKDTAVTDTDTTVTEDLKTLRTSLSLWTPHAVTEGTVINH